MPYTMSLNLQPKQTQNLKQTQLLMMMPQMQQAIHLLQIPVMELNQLIEEELEQNPVLEYVEEEEDGLSSNEKEVPESQDNPEKAINFDENDFTILKRLDEDFRDHFAESGSDYVHRTSDDEKYRAFVENSICAPKTLFNHLMEQAREGFNEPEEIRLAEVLIGNLNEKGYLHTPLEEIATLNQTTVEQLQAVLKQIQTFDPYGVGASSVQESFLIQLRRLNKEGTLAYKIVEHYYDDLLHKRIPTIQKKLGCTSEAIQQAIDHDISKLDLRPGMWYATQTAQHIYPDITLRQDGEQLIVEINDESVQPIRLNKRYLRMLDDETLPTETKEFIKQQIMSAKWLVRNISQRNETLGRIAQFLAVKQKDFFLQPDGKLTPLTMKEVAQELELHESTIARAVMHKYINSPKGLLPLRSFFTYAYVNEGGEDISSETVRTALKKLIEKEDKRHPLSDQTLSVHLQKNGLPCARRTVAKYRKELSIGNALQRRRYE